MLAQTEAQGSAPISITMPTTVVLRTADLVEFAVPMSQLTQASAVCAVLRGEKCALSMINAKSSVPVIEVSHVSSLILSKVLLFCQSSTELEAYNETTFVCSEANIALFSAEANEDLLQLAYAANMLDLPALMHVVGELIATKINGHEGDEINALFNLEGLEVEKQEDGEIEEGGDWEEMEAIEETQEKADK